MLKITVGIFALLGLLALVIGKYRRITYCDFSALKSTFPFFIFFYHFFHLRGYIVFYSPALSSKHLKNDV
jgi:hypothetical protein